jgi:hypothetical protein
MFAPLILFFTVAWLVWVTLFLADGGVEEVRRTKRHQFLGPGGPDDPLANDPFDDF